jgi:hypothetical protein
VGSAFTATPTLGAAQHDPIHEVVTTVGYLGADPRNRVAPDSACEGRLSVVAKKSPDSPAKRPFAEKRPTVSRRQLESGACSTTVSNGSPVPSSFEEWACRSRARPPGRSGRPPPTRRTRGRARSTASSPTAQAHPQSKGRCRVRRRADGPGPSTRGGRRGERASFLTPGTGSHDLRTASAAGSPAGLDH